MSVDTSREAVAGGVALLRTLSTALLHAERQQLADILDALLTERDALIADNARLLDSVTQESEARAAAEAERDAAFLRGWEAGLPAGAEAMQRAVRESGSVHPADDLPSVEGAIRALTPPEAAP